MKASQLYFKTYREDASNLSVNQRLLTRAAMIHQQSNGLFAILPIGMKILSKIEMIIEQELEKVGAQRMEVSLLSSKSVWDRAGRWNSYGPEMMRIKDRKEREYALLPTAEVEFLNLIDKDINSYKDFPFILYQITEKFRDEIRPRFGLLRARQFRMKDAYSFHSSESCLDNTFEKMKDAYVNIFNRLGLKFKICKADTGSIGGKDSLEFIVMTDAGEAEVLFCECGYTANIEKSTNLVDEESSVGEGLKEVHTPGMKKMSEVAKFLDKRTCEGIKCLVVKIENKFCLVVLRGDRDLNEAKMSALFGHFRYANDDEIRSLNLDKGFVGPVKSSLEVIADEEAVIGTKYCGANKEDMHFINCEYGRDWKASHIVDIRTSVKGDKCPECAKPMSYLKGIEVGHIFKIGNKYSEAMKSKFVDMDGKEKDILIASYGIGVTRALATIVEQNHDEGGITWPKEIAPYQMSIVISSIKREEQVKFANDLYEQLTAKGIDVLLDDRDLSASAKRKDHKLIGVPTLVIVDKSIVDSVVSIEKKSGRNAVKFSSAEVLLKEIGL